MLNLGATHKQPPQEARAVVLDHGNDRALVYRNRCGCVPVAGLVERRHEAALAPNLGSEILEEMAQ
jgi:hypothetical protein